MEWRPLNGDTERTGNTKVNLKILRFAFKKSPPGFGNISSASARRARTAFTAGNITPISLSRQKEGEGNGMMELKMERSRWGGELKQLQGKCMVKVCSEKWAVGELCGLHYKWVKKYNVRLVG